MAKYPEVGLVKTRLSRDITPESAAQLYECFLKDILTTLENTNIPVIIYFTPAEKEGQIKELLGKGYEYEPQVGINLGERLFCGFQAATKRGYSSAIALASDVPDIPEYIFEKARKALVNHEAVIGPSPDGGYYLIGFKLDHVQHEVFMGIQWSTHTVFKETMGKLKGVNTFVLDAWPDVDSLDDLLRLKNSCVRPQFANSHTHRYLKENLDLIGST